ncbi:MAG: 50S ribosomal protein L23 [Proteobacteria bacterium]|nr:50S ribosomal protein L23 [Pseudomonadota bacterium]
MKEPHHILIRPLITEKSTLQKEMNNQIAFEVHPKANKIEIKKALELAFKVKVVGIRTMNMDGKRKRVGRFVGRRPHWKKAVVKLAPGQSIEFFEGA